MYEHSLCHLYLKSFPSELRPQRAANQLNFGKVAPRVGQILILSLVVVHIICHLGLPTASDPLKHPSAPLWGPFGGLDCTSTPVYMAFVLSHLLRWLRSNICWSQTSNTSLSYRRAFFPHQTVFAFKRIVILPLSCLRIQEIFKHC